MGSDSFSGFRFVVVGANRETSDGDVVRLSRTGSTATVRDEFFKQHEIIGSTMGGYGEFADVVRLVEQGLPIAVDAELGVDDYPEALARLEAGDQMGKIVLAR